jgi:hypothetical protein
VSGTFIGSWGGMGFWSEEEVDSTRFVKLFLDGIKKAAGLSKPGIQVFELVCQIESLFPSVRCRRSRRANLFCF